MLHIRLTELHAARQNLPPAIHTLCVKKTIQNVHQNERNLTFVVRTYNVYVMCHRTKFHKIRGSNSITVPNFVDIA